VGVGDDLWMTCSTVDDMLRASAVGDVLLAMYCRCCTIVTWAVCCGRCAVGGVLWAVCCGRCAVGGVLCAIDDALYAVGDVLCAVGNTLWREMHWG